MYLTMKHEEKVLLLKFLLCFVLGMAITHFIGYTYSSTIVVSAVLMLYKDRNFVGSYTYSLRRIRVQMLVGGYVIAFITIFRYFIPVEVVPDFLLGILICVSAVLIFLPWQFKYTVAPLTVTMGDGIIIMCASCLKTTDYYWQRVMFCIIGAMLAHLINFYIVPPKSRYETMRTDLKSSTKNISDRIYELITNKGAKAGAALTAAGFNGGIAKVEGNVSHIKEEKDLKRFRKAKEDIAILLGLHELQKKAKDIIALNEKYSYSLSEEFKNYYYPILKNGLDTHLTLENCFMGEEKFHIDELPEFEAKSVTREEIALIGQALEYYKYINKMTDISNVYFMKEESRYENGTGNGFDIDNFVKGIPAATV